MLLRAASVVVPDRHRLAITRAFHLICGFRFELNVIGKIDEKPAMPRIIAYNHVSLYDAFVLAGIPNVAIISSDTRRLASRANGWVTGFSARLCRADVRVIADMRAFANMLKLWRQQPDAPILCAAPEGTVGNGKALFRFYKGLFVPGAQVVPVAIRCVPALPINMHPILAHHAFNYVWPLMLPWVKFQVDMLPPMERHEAEPSQAFADRVQAAIAAHLGIPATVLSKDDKAEYRRRLVRRADTTQQGPLAEPNRV
jgi:ancient ubiquitous protein 1